MNRRKRKKQSNKLKQFLFRKLNLEKELATDVASLYTFIQTLPTLHPPQRINGHSKQQHNIYELIHRRLSCNLKKSQSTNNEEDDMLSVSSWTPGTKIFIQAQSLFTHVFSNIVCELDSKSSEGQNIMESEKLKMPLYFIVYPQLIF